MSVHVCKFCRCDVTIANERGLPRGVCCAPHSPYPGLHESSRGVAGGLGVLVEPLLSLLDLPSSDGVQLREGVVAWGGRVKIGSVHTKHYVQ